MKWEYRYVAQSFAKNKAKETLEAELDRLGSEGWEAVGTASITAAELGVLLKRPASD